MANQNLNLMPEEEQLLTKLEEEYHFDDGLLVNKISSLKAFSQKCKEADSFMSFFTKVKDSTPDSDLGKVLDIATNGDHMLAMTILGKVFAEAASIEDERRRAIAALYAKFGYCKNTYRDMLDGYYVDDDGTASYLPDENGESEQNPGEFAS